VTRPDFRKWVTDNIKKEDKIAGVSLDSPGGSVREALLLADGVARTEVPTIVGPGENCISACFLIFAAGKNVLSLRKLMLEFTAS
jgi:hypothetical protein